MTYVCEPCHIETDGTMFEPDFPVAFVDCETCGTSARCIDCQPSPREATRVCPSGLPSCEVGRRTPAPSASPVFLHPTCWRCGLSILTPHAACIAFAEQALRDQAGGNITALKPQRTA